MAKVESKHWSFTGNPKELAEKNTEKAKSFEDIFNLGIKAAERRMAKSNEKERHDALIQSRADDKVARIEYSKHIIICDIANRVSIVSHTILAMCVIAVVIILAFK